MAPVHVTGKILLQKAFKDTENWDKKLREIVSSSVVMVGRAEKVHRSDNFTLGRFTNEFGCNPSCFCERLLKKLTVAVFMLFQRGIVISCMLRLR